VAFEDLGNLADVLRQAKLTVTYREAGLEPLGNIDPFGPELLVILGGPIGAYDEAHYPCVLEELRLLEARLTADLPTLGICLGSQLMARALGAKVYPGPYKELGWAPLQLTEAGRRSPLALLAGDQTAVLHWHGDTFDLPQGATHLASTPLYANQAFSWGQGSLALQFHPEVTLKNLERWWIGHACEIGSTPQISVTRLREETRHYHAQLQTQAVQFWQAWLHEVLAAEASVPSQAPPHV
jgi:GMP synthase (glutamine-hydrolysing)